MRSAAAIALVCAVLGGCTGEQFQKGYILPPGALEQIPIGASQDQVLIVMGTPSTVATLNGEVFYYISQRSERPIAFMNQRVIDQRVIAIYFDRNRQVQRLANYGLQDGRIFDFISRTTPTSGQELNYLTPLFKLVPSFHKLGPRLPGDNAMKKPRGSHRGVFLDRVSPFA
jgi:outer membrane protein assembly factor BamE (lipoprotein component of BamABCDE complex)